MNGPHSLRTHSCDLEIHIEMEMKTLLEGRVRSLWKLVCA